MNTSGTGFFAQQDGDWDVYKDAFTPAASRPPSKPWERALVSAHAPRLQGRKIWKRSGLRSQAGDSNKENIDAAEVELEKGGAGARKKARVLGTKQIIADALWQDAREDVEGMRVVSGVISPSKRDKEMDIGALLVPRKRTNANHLITPQRRTRRIPLEELGELVGSPLKGMPESQLGGVQLDLKASQESPRKIPLNDSAANTSPEKPVRRRKSMRKSTSRRLTRTSIEEQEIAPVEGLMERDSQAESTAEVATVLEATEETAEILVQDQTVDHIKSLEDANTTQEVLPSETEPEVSAVELRISNESPAELPSDDHINIAKTTEAEEHVTDVSLMGNESAIRPEEGENVLGETQEEAITIQDIPRLTPPRTLTAEEERNDPSLKECLKEADILNPASVASASAELPSDLSSSPTKTPRTPKRGKRSNSQQRGVRRSTRSTSTSTVLLDEKVPDHIQPIGTMTSPVKPASPVQSSNLEDHESVSVDELARITEVVEPAQEDEERFQEPGPGSQMPSPVKVETGDVILPEPTEKSEANSIASFEDACTEPSLLCGNTEEVEGDPAETLEVNNPGLQATIDNDEIDKTSSTPDPSVDQGITSRNLEISEVQFDTDLAIDLSNEVSVASPNSPHSTDVDLEEFEPVSISTVTESILDKLTPESEDLQESTTPDPSTTALVETICENAPPTVYNEDDTDLLRNFLTRVKANKEALAKSNTTKRKRSLPYSPIKLPLGSDETPLSPSPPPSKIDFDVSLPASSPTKRRKRGESSADNDDTTEPQSIRRSSRTRLPVKTAIAAPSFIPVRRLGQDGDNTITLRQNEEKELAALTKFNTRKNKGCALPAIDVLGKMASTHKEDPATRHQTLKQKFDEKTTQSQKVKKRKSVVWAVEIAQYQSADGKILGVQEKEKEKGKKKKPVTEGKEKPVTEEKNSIPVRATAEGKKSAPVRVGVRSSRIAMGMVANGTPAPKRRVKAVLS